MASVATVTTVPHRNEYKLFVVNTTPDFDPDSVGERILLAKVRQP